MSPLEVLAGQAQWAAQNTAYNLKFIPDDKLAWKPAPTAKSALDIANELIVVLTAMRPVLSGGAWTVPNDPPVTDRATAQNKIQAAAEAYATALKAVKPEDLNKTIELPFGTFPLHRCSSFPVIDLIHHHGQLAYIQTLLGDTESHFFEFDNA